MKPVAELVLEQMAVGDASSLRVHWLTNELPPVGTKLYTNPHPDNLGLAESIIKQQELKIDNLLENNARLDAEIEVLKADNDKLTEALLKANRVYDFDNPLLDKELEK